MKAIYNNKLSMRFKIYLFILRLFCGIITEWGGAVVACQAHNLKVVGSNPTPATKIKRIDDKFLAFVVNSYERV